MSGGHFNYSQHKVADIAESIDKLIKDHNIKNLCGYSNDYPQEIIDKFIEAKKALEISAKMARRIDWLVSGGDSENTFLSLWEKEIKGTVK